MVIRLYGGARSRASIVQWYLEELSIPYEFVLIDLQAKEQHRPNFLAINPFGKVPAVVDGDRTIWESGAILLYLAEVYGVPGAQLNQRIEWAQWVLFANSTLTSGLFIEGVREKETPHLLQPINQRLEEASYLLGGDLSVADIAVASVLAYASLMVKLDYTPYPGILRYLTHLSARPAFQNTIGWRSPHRPKT